ncbi:MAG: hypothetical protein LBS99_02110 [Clostridiales bacterium]|jgi:hypothetical protein|nr:hypothetical protein [Clostridiales bacterium]
MNIYEYQRPVGKIDDIPELKNEFIAVYDTKTHHDMARFCLVYGRHLLEIMRYEPFDEGIRAYRAIQEWLDGKVNYQKARSVGGEFNDLARAEKDPAKARFYRTMAQISCVTHVKYHAIWACDFAVTLINRIFPNDLNEVRKERQKQIEIVKSI